jgi:hypothetical protein
VLAMLAWAPSSALAQQPSITLQAPAPQVRSGSHVTLSGQVTEAPAGSQVALSQAPYPYTSSSQVASVAPDASGNFSFTVSPAINTKYEVMLAGTSAQASVQVAVTSRLVVKVKALPLGRAGITVHVYHPSSLHWGKRAVQWTFAEGKSNHFKAGWRPSPDIFLVHQAARLEGHGRTFSLAIMTDGDNGMGDGISKIQGTTSALLR